ncbi:glycosyltransferase [Bradyrhizobium denitrificans]
MELARAARDAGFEVVVATNVLCHRRAIEREGFRVVEMTADRASLSPLALCRSLALLRNILCREQPDLIHALAIRSIVLLAASTLIGRRYPLVASFIGLGYLWSRRGWAGRMIRQFVRLQTSWIARSPAAVVTFENADDRLEFPRLRNGIVIGGWGVEIEAPQSTRKVSDDVVRVAFLGRMLRAKGIEDAVAAVQLARKQDRRIELELWGRPDPDNPTSYTADELTRLSSADGVKWMGEAPDVATVWERADVAILLSEREGMPRALIEAAGHGLPMIATNVPGCRSIIQDGVNGLLVPSNNPAVAAEAILRLAQDVGLRERMGQMAREQFERSFSKDAVVPRILEIYSRLIGSRLRIRHLAEVSGNDESQPILS